MKFILLLTDSAKLWVSRDMANYSAAFSYYAPLALVPVILLSLAISGFFYGNDFVAAIFQSWGTVLGDDLLALIQLAVQNLDGEVQTYKIPLLAILFFSAVSIVAFNVLSTGFQLLWDVHRSGFVYWLRQSARSVFVLLILQAHIFFIVGVEGLLTALSIKKVFLLPDLIWLFSVSLVFVLLFRFLVWTSPSLKGCIAGGLVTGVLFVFAKSLVSIYLFANPVLDIFGATGLVFILFVWVFILGSIIFYGASVAHTYDKMKSVIAN